MYAYINIYICILEIAIFCTFAHTHVSYHRTLYHICTYTHLLRSRWLQVMFRRRATDDTALLQKMTYEDKAYYCMRSQEMQPRIQGYFNSE